MTSKKSASSSPYDAVLSFEYDEPVTAQRVERAIAPEIGDIDGDRSTVRLARDDSRLELTVEATDPVALRAGLNTWFSLVAVAETSGADSAGSASIGPQSDG